MLQESSHFSFLLAETPHASGFSESNFYGGIVVTVALAAHGGHQLGYLGRLAEVAAVHQDCGDGASFGGDRRQRRSLFLFVVGGLAELEQFELLCQLQGFGEALSPVPIPIVTVLHEPQ